jgi:hypothetical protein
MLKETASAKRYLDEALPGFTRGLYTCAGGGEFFRIIRNRDLAALPEWLTAAKKTALVGFANRLARDQQAHRSSAEAALESTPS